MNWKGLRWEMEKIFEKKTKKLGLKSNMEIQFIEDAPIGGEYVYGEAFPNENKIRLEVVAPDASIKEITKTICHELIHLKFPELNHDSEMFEEMVRNSMKN